MAYAPVSLLNIVIGILTLGTGVFIVIWQTGATRQALRQRRGNLTGGVLLILIGVVALLISLITLLK